MAKKAMQKVNNKKVMDNLIKEATSSAKYNGHKLTRWSKDKTKATAICKTCFSSVFVDVSPSMPGVIVGGSGLTRRC